MRHLKAVENLKKEVYMASNRQQNNADEDFFIKEMREATKSILHSLDSDIFKGIEKKEGMTIVREQIDELLIIKELIGKVYDKLSKA